MDPTKNHRGGQQLLLFSTQEGRGPASARTSRSAFAKIVRTNWTSRISLKQISEMEVDAEPSHSDDGVAVGVSSALSELSAHYEVSENSACGRWAVGVPAMVLKIQCWPYVATSS